jgi:glucokinase
MSNGKTYLGVDIGGTSVKLGLVDEQGVIRYSEAYDAPMTRMNTTPPTTLLSSNFRNLICQKLKLV